MGYFDLAKSSSKSNSSTRTELTFLEERLFAELLEASSDQMYIAAPLTEGRLKASAWIETKISPLFCLAF